jgi:hypothetical protein
MAAVNSLPFPPSAEDGDIVIRDELIGVYHANINTWEVKRLGGPPSLSVSTVDPWVDKAWGTNSIVVWKGRLYAALTPVVAGDPAPDDPANNKWRDVTNPGAKGDKGDQGDPPPVFFVTATQIGNLVRQFPSNTQQQNLDLAYRVVNPTGPKENEFFVVSTVGSKDDEYAGTFVRKGTNWNPAGGGGSGSGGTTAQNFRAATTTAQVPGKSQGDLDIVTEDKNHQLNVFDGSSFVTVFSEQQIKGWVASGSLFQGTLSDDTGLANLPTPANANRGFYWTWTGSASHSTTVPISVTLQVGDWLQSDGVTYVHVPSDLMSKLRWESVGSFRPWIDGSFEQASLVSYNGALYRANSAIVPGDVAPDDPAAKWTKLSFTRIDELTNVEVDTPNIAEGQILRYSLLDAKWKNVKLNLGDLDKVSANVIDPDVHGAVLQWDDNVNEWVSSDTIQIGAIRFDDVGVGPEITGFADTDFSVTTPSEESSYVPSVYAVKEYISAQPKPFLEELGDCGDLATAVDGDVPSWDSATTSWKPKAIKEGIPLFKGTFSVGSKSGNTYTPPATPKEEDIWVDKNQDPPVFKVYRSGAWVLVNWQTDHLGLLSDLANVNVGASGSPGQGDALIYNQLTEQWESGAVPAHITEYDRNVNYSAGTTVYYKGGLFEAKTRTSGTSPAFIYGDCWLYHRAAYAGTGDWVGPISFETVNVVADATQRQRLSTSPATYARTGRCSGKTINTSASGCGSCQWLVGRLALHLLLPGGTTTPHGSPSPTQRASGVTTPLLPSTSGIAWSGSTTIPRALINRTTVTSLGSCVRSAVI